MGRPRQQPEDAGTHTQGIPLIKRHEHHCHRKIAPTGFLLTNATNHHPNNRRRQPSLPRPAHVPPHTQNPRRHPIRTQSRIFTAHQNLRRRVTNGVPAGAEARTPRCTTTAVSPRRKVERTARMDQARVVTALARERVPHRRGGAIQGREVPSGQVTAGGRQCREERWRKLHDAAPLREGILPRRRSVRSPNLCDQDACAYPV